MTKLNYLLRFNGFLALSNDRLSIFLIFSIFSIIFITFIIFPSYLAFCQTYIPFKMVIIIHHESSIVFHCCYLAMRMSHAIHVLSSTCTCRNVYLIDFYLKISIRFQNINRIGVQISRQLFICHPDSLSEIFSETRSNFSPFWSSSLRWYSVMKAIYYRYLKPLVHWDEHDS